MCYLMYMLFHPLKPIEDWMFRILYFFSKINKLAKARKMRKPPGTLGLKKFGPKILRKLKKN